MTKRTSLLLLGTVMTLLGCCGCCRKIYLPVEHVVVHRDSTHAVTLHTDTVLRTDSVIIERRGDTVYHTAWRLREHTARHIDTLVRVVHDTVSTTSTIVADTPPATRKSLISRLTHSAWGWLAKTLALLLIALIIRFIWRQITTRHR